MMENSSDNVNVSNKNLINKKDVRLCDTCQNPSCSLRTLDVSTKITVTECDDWVCDIDKLEASYGS